MTAKTAAMIPQCDIPVSEYRETNMHLQALHKLSYPLMLYTTILRYNLILLLKNGSLPYWQSAWQVNKLIYTMYYILNINYFLWLMSVLKQWPMTKYSTFVQQVGTTFQSHSSKCTQRWLARCEAKVALCWWLLQVRWGSFTIVRTIRLVTAASCPAAL